MEPDAVVFDLDNTLCRRTGDVDAAYRRAFDRVGVEPFGAPTEVWDAVDGPPDPDDRTGYIGAGIARVAAHHGRTVDPVAVADAFLDEIDNSEVELLPGAESVLAAARRLGAIGILTNGPERRQRVKVETLGLDDTADAIVYAGDLRRRKPHVEPFELILDDLGTSGGRTLYVGDSLAHDVAGAHNAGLPVAWLGRGDDPGGYDPDYVLDSLADLEPVLADG